MRLFFLLTFVVLTPLIGIAQHEKAYVDSILDYLEHDPSVKVDDFALIDRVCSQADSVSQSINYFEGMFRSDLIRTQVYRDFPDEKVEPWLERMLALLEEHPRGISGEYILEYYLVRGYLSGKKGLFLDELNFYLKADSLCKHTSLAPSLHLYVEQHLAMYYFTQGDYDEARIIFEDIIDDQEQQGIPNPAGYALYLVNLGVIHKHLGEPRKAIHYIQKGLALGSGEYKDALFQFSMLAEAYLQVNAADSAKIYLNEASKLISNENQTSIDLVDFYLVSSHYHFTRNEYTAGDRYASLAIELSDTLHFVNGAMEGYKWRIKNNLAMSPLEGRVQDYSALIQLKDSLNKRSSLELEKKYLVQYRTLEQEALARQKEAENNQLILENQLYKSSLMLYGALALALIALLILAIQRHRKKRMLVQGELEVSQLEKESMEIALHQREKELAFNIDLLHENRKKMDALKASGRKAESLQQIQEIFENSSIQESQWDRIILQFEAIHPVYMAEIKASGQDFTRNDIKMAILDKLGYSNQGMQEILNISYEGVKKAKQRFKRKLNSET